VGSAELQGAEKLDRGCSGSAKESAKMQLPRQEGTAQLSSSRERNDRLDERPAHIPVITELRGLRERLIDQDRQIVERGLLVIEAYCDEVQNGTLSE
jgi:hypothetical protein